MNKLSDSTSGHIAVPPYYIGIWRRDLLSSAAGEDTSTRVLWMQADRLFVDLRIPANRPDFSSVASLDECSDEQLDWLAGQQGFAGWLQVTGDRFEWHRVLDFQPDRTVQDIGRMSLQEDYVLEEGVLADYYEHWRKMTHDNPFRRAYSLGQVTAADGQILPWKGYLLIVGCFFMLAIDRREDLGQATSLRALAQGDRQQLLKALDMEISYGLLYAANGSCEIQSSTHPFREGVTLFPGVAELSTQRQLVHVLGDNALHWNAEQNYGSSA
jgi:hypothetical protein